MFRTVQKTVLFLTDEDDPLPKQFALESTKYALDFSLTRPVATDWWIAWVCDGEGQPQASLGHLPSGAAHFLGTDPEAAMRSACRLISEWDRLEPAHEVLKIQ